jgi:hypothetical protein
MNHEWHVEVKTHEGTPVQDATVALQPEIFPEVLGMTYPFYDLPGTRFLAFALSRRDVPRRFRSSVTPSSTDRSCTTRTNRLVTGTSRTGTRTISMGE